MFDSISSRSNDELKDTFWLNCGFWNAWLIDNVCDLFNSVPESPGVVGMVCTYSLFGVADVEQIEGFFALEETCAAAFVPKLVADLDKLLLEIMIASFSLLNRSAFFSVWFKFEMAVRTSLLFSVKCKSGIFFGCAWNMCMSWRRAWAKSNFLVFNKPATEMRVK